MEAEELRNMTPDEIRGALAEMQQDLMHERGVAAMGGQPPDPGRIRTLRKNVARIKTIMNERDIEESSPGQRGTS
jgi:large subunit ribosomal protein L29